MLYKLALLTLFVSAASAQDVVPSAASSSLATAAPPGIPVTDLPGFSSSSGASASSLSRSAASVAQPSATGTSPPAGGQTLLAELSDNPSYTTFAAAINASSPLLNLTALLSDSSQELTVLVPPSDAFQAASDSPFISSLSANISETESVPLLDALLALHILNGSFSAETITTALRANIGGLSMPTLLEGAALSVYGFLAGRAEEQTASASSSASAPIASASSGDSSPRIFVNNALVVRPNALQVGNSYVHELSNVLDPFLPLLGQTLPVGSDDSPSVIPTWIVQGANATTSGPEPTISSGVSSASLLPVSSSRSASSASISPDAIGPLRPSTSAGSSASAVAKRWTRWDDTY